MTDVSSARGMNWCFPIELGPLRDLAGLCLERVGKTRLIVTERSTARRPLAREVINLLATAALRHELFDEVSPIPADHAAAVGKAAFLNDQRDDVIALCGGPGMDAGKATSLIINTSCDLWDFDNDNAPPIAMTRKDFVPLIGITTTARTGAATASTARVTNTPHRIKGSAWQSRQEHFAANLDPERTVGLPANLTARTGCADLRD